MDRDVSELEAVEALDAARLRVDSREDLVPYIGTVPLEHFDVDVLDRYVVAARLDDGLAPGTVNRQLNVVC